LKTATKTLSKRARMMFDATNSFGDALTDEFDNLGKVLRLGSNDIGELFNIINKKLWPYLKEFFGESVGSRAECVWQKARNIKSCSKYYGFGVFVNTIYSIFVLFPASLIKIITKFNALKIVRQMENSANRVDTQIHKLTGFRVLQWSDEVKDRCFRCTNLKPMPVFPLKPFNDHTEKMKHDFNQEMPRMLNEAKGKFVRSGIEFKNVFNAKAASTSIDDDIGNELTSTSFYENDPNDVTL